MIIQRSSSSPSPIFIRGPTPFIAPAPIKTEPEVVTSDSLTEQDSDIPFDEESSLPIDVAQVYRPGGVRVYDVAIQKMPMPLKGLTAQTWRAREEDIIYYSDAKDKDKAMTIIWGR